MIVLGIDPGLNTTGYGVVEFAAADEPLRRSSARIHHGESSTEEMGPRTPRLVEAGVVRGHAKGTLAERVAEIHRGVAEVIAALKPEVMAIEELYSHYDRPTTAILMGHARGVICLAAAEACIPLSSYPATQIKKTITGNGHAAKWQIQAAIRHELGLPADPEPADVADALAIALCHCYLRRSSSAVGGQ
jgi:crossover junction endodeoxyribonuclease RuvC